MAMRQGLALRQTQRLSMTPQLRQSIAMLRMTAPELEAFLSAEVERNPLLSLDNNDREPPQPHAMPGEAHVGGPPGRYGEVSPGARREDADAAHQLRAPETLADHVRAQLGLARLDPLERWLADLLCGDLDEDGYLRTDLDETAERLGAPQAALERAAAAIRACEPAGVGARDLAECLALQLAERGALDETAAALLAHLDQLPTTTPARLAALCAMSETALADALTRLRQLDPRPGRRFAPPALTPPAPDVLVEPDGAGWRATLNPDTTPRLLVDRDYALGVGAAATAGPARRFLGDCVRSADWLRRSLDQRARTILAVAGEIVARQGAFFDGGAAHLRPLTMREIAEAVDIHESTVSRATANKTMATPRGVLDMRFFFSAAVGSTETGEARAATAIQARLGLLVAAESKDKPLSDDALVRALDAEGIAVARRTVAKYREALGIPSSVERRRRAAAATALC